MKRSKERLDLLLVKRSIVPSRNLARSVIIAGKVLVDGSLVDKIGKLVDTESEISVIKSSSQFVSRAGEKLADAIRSFGIDIKDNVAIDIGASTGGFTDALLQFGAKRVWAIDVGTNQLDYRLRINPKVISLEKTNARTFDFQANIKETVDIIVADLSFISLKLVIPNSLKILKENGKLVVLIKPQFEVGKDEVSKAGVPLKEESVIRCLDELKSFFESQSLSLIDMKESPIRGLKSKNKEYLAYLKKKLDFDRY